MKMDTFKLELLLEQQRKLIQLVTNSKYIITASSSTPTFSAVSFINGIANSINEFNYDPYSNVTFDNVNTE